MSNQVLKPSQVEVDPSEWVRANGGRRPSGRGGWAFCLVNPRRDDYLDFVVWANGPYGAAKKAAQAVALGKLQAPGAYQVGSEQVRVSFSEKAAELLKSGHASVLYVCS